MFSHRLKTEISTIGTVELLKTDGRTNKTPDPNTSSASKHSDQTNKIGCLGSLAEHWFCTAVSWVRSPASVCEIAMVTKSVEVFFPKSLIDIWPSFTTHTILK